jgi:methionine synthase I (cobalamin-dependent)
LLLDGGMATSLFERGLEWEATPGEWNLTHPEVVRGVHRGFLEAGCDMVQTNTFLWEGLSHAALAAGVRLARREVEAHGRGWVAGNLGPSVQDRSLSELRAHAAEAAAVLAAEGADWISVETLGALEPARALVEGAREGGAGLAVTACVTLSAEESDLRVLGGASLAEAAAVLEAAGACAVGLNCSAGGAQLLRALPELLCTTSLPVLAKPNAGQPREVAGRLEWSLSPAEFAAAVLELVEGGAHGVGGCCGVHAAHLAAARRALDARQP